MAKKRDEIGMQSRLMTAAMTAFCRRGLADCRMSDIADAAGLARGTPYLYFKSKEQLMLAMYQLYSNRMLERQKSMLAKAGDLPARQLLELACQACLQAGMSHRLIRLSVHERAAAQAQTRPVQTFQVPDLFGSPGWPARAS
jgi:AcrR family transcriptional regulator